MRLGACLPIFSAARIRYESGCVRAGAETNRWGWGLPPREGGAEPAVTGRFRQLNRATQHHGVAVLVAAGAWSGDRQAGHRHGA